MQTIFAGIEFLYYAELGLSGYYLVPGGKYREELLHWWKERKNR